MKINTEAYEFYGKAVGVCFIPKKEVEQAREFGLRSAETGMGDGILIVAYSGELTEEKLKGLKEVYVKEKQRLYEPGFDSEELIPVEVTYFGVYYKQDQVICCNVAKIGPGFINII